jgi:predicted nucleic acid-binding protein
VDGFCRKVRFLGQNPKIGYQKFNDLQSAKISKKQLCDRTVLRASRVLLVADNVAIAREAARAQAAYRRRGGRREVLIPDFVIGANATYYAGRLLTTNPRDFFQAFPALEVLTPQAFLAQYAPAPRPSERQE